MTCENLKESMPNNSVGPQRLKRVYTAKYKRHSTLPFHKCNLAKKDGNKIHTKRTLGNSYFLAMKVAAEEGSVVVADNQTFSFRNSKGEQQASHEDFFSFQDSHDKIVEPKREEFMSQPLRDRSLPSSHEQDIEEDREQNAAMNAVMKKKKQKKRRKNYCIGCMICHFITILVIVILALTLFKVKKPKMRLEDIKVEDMSSQFDQANMAVKLNMTLATAIAIYNPNRAASFKHGNTTADVYYRGSFAGQAIIPPGNIGAHSTSHINATVVVFANVFVNNGGSGSASVPALLNDALSGTITMSSRTVMAGRVNILHLFKKHVRIRSSCDVAITLSTKEATPGKCSNKIKL